MMPEPAERTGRGGRDRSAWRPGQGPGAAEEGETPARAPAGVAHAGQAGPRSSPRTPTSSTSPSGTASVASSFVTVTWIELGSRNERPLTRYFPELVDAFASELPPRCVVDGEIVIVGDGGLDFEALLQRIHPAESRVRMLASTTPASFVAFDLLALGDDDLRTTPFAERRRRLEAALDRAGPVVHLTPATDDPDVAREWFSTLRRSGARRGGGQTDGPALPRG